MTLTKASESGMYVCRLLLNSHELREWADRMVLPTLDDYLHVTVVYSPTDFAFEPDQTVIEAWVTGVQHLGKDGAVVLNLEAPKLFKQYERHHAAGATSTYETGYKPHLTLFYDHDFDLRKVPIPPFPLLLGEERGWPLAESFQDQMGLIAKTIIEKERRKWPKGTPGGKGGQWMPKDGGMGSVAASSLATERKGKTHEAKYRARQRIVKHPGNELLTRIVKAGDNSALQKAILRDFDITPGNLASIKAMHAAKLKVLGHVVRGQGPHTPKPPTPKPPTPKPPTPKPPPTDDGDESWRTRGLTGRPGRLVVNGVEILQDDARGSAHPRTQVVRYDIEAALKTLPDSHMKLVAQKAYVRQVASAAAEYKGHVPGVMGYHTGRGGSIGSPTSEIVIGTDEATWATQRTQAFKTTIHEMGHAIDYHLAAKIRRREPPYKPGSMRRNPKYFNAEYLSMSPAFRTAYKKARARYREHMTNNPTGSAAQLGYLFSNSTEAFTGAYMARHTYGGAKRGYESGEVIHGSHGSASDFAKFAPELMKLMDRTFKAEGLE